MPPADLLTALRDQNPLVHCITNYVAMNIAANVVLAAGASPAMLHAEEEISEFTPAAGALTLNIGTLSASWLKSMNVAARVATDSNVPWVLDPVAHFVSTYRRNAAQDLLRMQPTIIRGNASEIISLSGQISSGKGADSGDEVETAHDAATNLAQQYGSVVAVTGPIDFVTDGTSSARIKGGSELMPKVTALGCALTALMGGYAAVGPAFDAAKAALAHFKVAGQRAAEEAAGPGSFETYFIDELAATRPDDLGTVILP